MASSTSIQAPDFGRPRLVAASLVFLLLTVAYNAVEGVIAMASGIAAGSTALVGFGLDSFIEVFAAGLVLAQFSRLVRHEEGHEAAARRAEFLIGVTFLILALYVLAEAAYTLATGEEPDVSTVGIGLALASLAIMPALGLAKLACARRLDIRVLQAEAKETMICAGLSVVLLAGLGLNALWGLWWADPVAALVMIPYIVKEGQEAMFGEDGEDDE